MSMQSDLFDQAAECQRQIGLSADPYRQLTFRLLRDLWIALANESPSVTEVRLCNEIAAIKKIQNVAESGTRL